MAARRDENLPSPLYGEFEFSQSMAPLDVPSAQKIDLTGAVAAPVTAVWMTPGMAATVAWAFADMAAVKARATRAKRIACEVFILLLLLLRDLLVVV